MYPFERFTETAKQALAQQEAERSYHSYIGTEHMLLGLVQAGGTAATVLSSLSVRLEDVRRVLESRRQARIVIQQMIPTSRVKKVVELAFAEARRSGRRYVGTEHLLLGLLVEGEGVAAQVLKHLGVSLERVYDTLGALASGDALMPEPVSPPPAAGEPLAEPSRVAVIIDELMARARQLALADGTAHVDHGHLLAALAQDDSGRAVRTLRHLGVDVEALRRALLPPDDVMRLRRELRDALNRGVEAADLEERYRDLRSAEQRWLDSLD